MSLYDKWDVDFIKSHKQLGNIRIEAFYYKNSVEDCVHMYFTWNNQTDNEIGDSVFEALNRTPSLAKTLQHYSDCKYFTMKLDRNNATRIAAGLEVEIEITKLTEDSYQLDAA